MPFGLKRVSSGARIERHYTFSRFAPVWWSRIGLLGLVRGFRFAFVEGSCYALGGDVPRALLDAGLLDRYRMESHGLITSEEDVMVTLMCSAARLPLHEIDRTDPSWREVNRIGAAVLDQLPGRVPYVYHALKPTPEHAALRARIKSALPFFAGQPASGPSAS